MPHYSAFVLPISSQDLDRRKHGGKGQCVTGQEVQSQEPTLFQVMDGHFRADRARRKMSISVQTGAGGAMRRCGSAVGCGAARGLASLSVLSNHFPCLVSLNI